MKYMMLVCADPDAVPPEPVEDIQPWVDELEARGARLTGNRLRPVADATTVSIRAGEVLIADGPFAETKEQIAGFDILECADLDEAVDIASRHPVAKFGVLELRPFWNP